MGPFQDRTDGSDDSTSSHGSKPKSGPGFLEGPRSIFGEGTKPKKVQSPTFGERPENFNFLTAVVKNCHGPKLSIHGRAQVQARSVESESII